MILIAFDVDGTLDSSGGPVRWALVRAVAVASGARLGIVSPSAQRPRDDTPAFLPAGGGSRRANLIAFADACAAHGPEHIRLYVSNNGDQDEAAAAGFIYVTERDFARAVGG